MLKDDNEALLKQIEQFNLDILPEKSVNSKKNNNKKISTNKIKNNFNSNEIKFTHSTGISTTIMVNDSTTVGEVITQLYTKMNIPKEKKLALLLNATCFNSGCNDQNKFKNLLTKQNPDEVILVLEK